MPHHCPVQRASFRSSLARRRSISISFVQNDDVGLLGVDADGTRLVGRAERASEPRHPIAA